MANNANQNKKGTEPRTFKQLLATTQQYVKQAEVKGNGVVATLDDGSVVTIVMDSFTGDNGQKVRGIRISGLGGKPKFFMANVFARMFSPEVVEAAQEFMGTEVEENQES